MDLSKLVMVPESTYHTVIGRDNEEFEIYGKLLGQRSSRSEAHNGHSAIDGGTGEPVYVPQGQRCSRCRWFEVYIYRVERFFGEDCTCSTADDDNHDGNCGELSVPSKFLVVTYGPTIVPGELVKRSLKWADEPFMLFELLVQNGVRGRFLPSTSALALATAAHHDEDLFVPWGMFAYGKTFN